MKETAQKLIKATALIESFRGAVNEVFSKAPSDMEFNFPVALDQIADHQYKLGSEAWGKLVNDDPVGAEAVATSATEEAQRIALNAWRAYVEVLQKEADSVEREVRKIQVDVSELVAFKNQADGIFQRAMQMHERNERVALEELRKAEVEYKNYTSKASEKIAGTRAITKREVWRQRAAYISVVLALLALIVTLVGRENVLAFLKHIFTNLAGQRGS